MGQNLVPFRGSKSKQPASQGKENEKRRSPQQELAKRDLFTVSGNHVGYDDGKGSQYIYPAEKEVPGFMVNYRKAGEKERIHCDGYLRHIIVDQK